MSDHKPVKDYLDRGVRVRSRNRSGKRGTVIDVLPYGVFLVQWDDERRPWTVTRHDVDTE